LKADLRPGPDAHGGGDVLGEMELYATWKPGSAGEWWLQQL